MVQYKYYYFNLRARGEVVRLIFAAAGEKYEDIRFEFQGWPEYKKKAPLGQAPFLEIHDDDKVQVLSQSVTIARFLARKFNIAGKDDYERSLVEMYGDQVTDVINEFGKIMHESDEGRKKQMQQKLESETAPHNLKLFDDRLAKSGSGFIASSGMTWADLYLFNLLEFFGEKRVQILEHFPNVKALDQNIRSNPKIAEYLAKRPVTHM